MLIFWYTKDKRQKHTRSSNDKILKAQKMNFMFNQGDA